MPVIRTQDRVASLSPGDVLEVLCTDPGARSDIPSWCRINGHRMLDIQERDDEIVLTLQVGGGSESEDPRSATGRDDD